MTTNQDRAKRWLLAGILIFGGIGVYLHLHLQKKRADEMEARDNAPINRAKRAIQEADRATVNGDSPRARLYLVNARQALEEAIKLGPITRQLLHNRLVIIRRQLHLAEQAQHYPKAIQFGRDALEQAKRLFDEDRTDSRSRADRLSTSREFASLPTVSPKEASRALRHAAIDVDTTHKNLPATEVIRIQLAKTWLESARWLTKLKQKPEALSAAHRALTLAREAGQSSEPINVLSTAYLIATTAADLAKALNASPEQLKFEESAVEIMHARIQLQPLKASLPQSLASRLSKLADVHEALGDAQKSMNSQRQATQILEQALATHPTDQQVAWSYVRCLNLMGALYSTRDMDKDSLASYKKAYEHLDKLPNEAGRTRVITMGNYAQLLGRLDRMKAARRVAKQAYELAMTFTGDTVKAKRPTEDTASAGLRLARLLRAKPNVRRRQALDIARREQKRLKDVGEYTSKRRNQILRGLQTLIKELR